MTQQIALLRGVNVNGRTIRSEELAEVFRRLGFGEVRTVLASGNVSFEVPRVEASAALKARIEQALEDRFGYDAWIVLLDRSRLEAVVADFPFEPERYGWHPYVLFGSDAAALDAIEALAIESELDAGDDVIARGDGVIYWHNRRERGINSRFAKLTARTRFRPTTTTRNFRTLRRLLS